jgi:hypothetical protein
MLIAPHPTAPTSCAPPQLARGLSPLDGRDLVAVEDAALGQQVEVAAQFAAAVLELDEGVGHALHRVRRRLADALRVHQRFAGDLGLAGADRAAVGIAPQRQDGQQDAADAGQQQDAQLARQRQVADQRQAQVVVGTATPALRPRVRRGAPQQAGQAQRGGPGRTGLPGSRRGFRGAAAAAAAAGMAMEGTPNWVSGEASTVLPSATPSLSLARKSSVNLDANPIATPVQKL